MTKTYHTVLTHVVKIILAFSEGSADIATTSTENRRFRPYHRHLTPSRKFHKYPQKPHAETTAHGLHFPR